MKEWSSYYVKSIPIEGGGGTQDNWKNVGPGIRMSTSISVGSAKIVLKSACLDATMAEYQRLTNLLRIEIDFLNF